VLHLHIGDIIIYQTEYETFPGIVVRINENDSVDAWIFSNINQPIKLIANIKLGTDIGEFMTKEDLYG
jgi:hypothetical protein